jgi:uncharacterized protein with HEPN domain
MSHRSIELLIEDLWEAVGKVERYTDGLDHDRFVQDEKTIDSVVRNFEVIGEAAWKLPLEFRDRHSDVPWKKIIGLRHRIVHDYFDIDLEIIWQILERDIPSFKQNLLMIREKKNIQAKP